MSSYAQTINLLIDGLIDDARLGLVSLPVFSRVSDPRKIWYELAFCISSTQERSKKAKAAADALYASFTDLKKSTDVLKTVKESLASSFISLRFMNRKSEQLAASWEIFSENTDKMVRIDSHFSCPSEARDYLVETYPGIGPKQASMLLRNIGWGDDLAIIDTHISRISHLILEDRKEIETYKSLEGKLRSYALDRDISLHKLDVILWSCARAVRKDKIGELTLV